MLSFVNRSFSIARRTLSSTPLRFSAGKVDSALSDLLAKEKNFELETEQSTSFISDFTSKHAFKIVDVAGSSEISFVRQFGNENVSTDDLEDSVEMDESEEEDETSPPLGLLVTIEKTTGCLELQLTLEADAFFIDSAQYAAAPSTFTSRTSESDAKRRALYTGPNYAQLDEKLQDVFLDFLQERGFGEDLAKFIPSYIEFKEQNEYVNWLSNVESFVRK